MDERTLFLCGSDDEDVHRHCDYAARRAGTRGSRHSCSQLPPRVPRRRPRGRKRGDGLAAPRPQRGADSSRTRARGTTRQRLRRGDGRAAPAQPGEAVSYNNASFGIAGAPRATVAGCRMKRRFARSSLSRSAWRTPCSSLPPDDDAAVRRRPSAAQDGGAPVGDIYSAFRGGRIRKGGSRDDDSRLGLLGALPPRGRGLRPFPGAPLGRCASRPAGQRDAVGVSWLLSDVAGLCVVGHGGARCPGQLSLFKTVPERGSARVLPRIPGFRVQRADHALGTGDGARKPIPPNREPVARSADDVTPFCGRYETVANVVTVAPSGHEVIDRPEVLAELGIDPEQPIPFLFGPQRRPRHHLHRAAVSRQHGFFVRDGDGAVAALNAFGRHTVRTD